MEVKHDAKRDLAKDLRMWVCGLAGCGHQEAVAERSVRHCSSGTGADDGQV